MHLFARVALEERDRAVLVRGDDEAIEVGPGSDGELGFDGVDDVDRLVGLCARGQAMETTE